MRCLGSIQTYWKIKSPTFDFGCRGSLHEDQEYDQSCLVGFKGAGRLFDVSEDSDYVHTLLAKAIDEYANLKTKAAEANDDSVEIDPRLEAIVEKMLDKYV